MKTEWNLKLVYETEKDWIRDFERIRGNIEQLKHLLPSCIDSKEKLQEFLELKESADYLVEKTYCYAKRHTDLDSTLVEYKEKASEVLKFYGILQELTSSFEERISKNQDKVFSYLEGELKRYTRYVHQIIRKKEHIPNHLEIVRENQLRENEIRTKYQETINAMQFKGVIVEGEEKELNRSIYSAFMLEENPSVRKDAYFHYTESYSREASTFYECYLKKLENELLLARAGNYTSLLEKTVFELELSPKVITSLLAKTNENLSIMQEYTTYKKNSLHLEEFHVYDNNLSICSFPKIEYKIEKAVAIIKEALSILGEDYVAIIDTMFKEGWIDVYPKENKRKMSFSCISYTTVPYILINYQNDLNSLCTLAHEIGHTMNTYYSKANNSFLYFEFSMFLT